MSNRIASAKILMIKIRRKMGLVVSSAFDFLLFQIRNLWRHSPEKKQDRKIIVYLCELIPARAGRMAKWVGRNPAFEVVLVCHQDGYVPEFAGGHFSREFTYRNAWHLKSVLQNIGHIDVIHAFAPKCFYPEIGRKFTHKPFILDMQDVVVTYHGLTPPYAWAKKELVYEKDCLTEADWVIGQSLEPRAGYLKYGIKKRPQTMFFPLFCDDDSLMPQEGKTLKDGIHVVYAGGLAGSHRDRRQFGILQFHHLIESLSRQGIHFHVYPSPSTLPPDYEEYYGIAAKNPFFHMHKPVDNDALTQELAKYHFGILPFFAEDSDLKEDKMKYATSLKMFNFLEAGIPVIISRDIFYQWWIVMRKNSGVAVSKSDIPDLGEKLRSLDYEQLQKNVDKYRRELSLSRHIPRITQLYQRLIQS
ncbi:MAG: hypothetical protein R3D00_01880 [Bacteroidia bacterium]